MNANGKVLFAALYVDWLDEHGDTPRRSAAEERR